MYDVAMLLQAVAPFVGPAFRVLLIVLLAYFLHRYSEHIVYNLITLLLRIDRPIDVTVITPEEQAKRRETLSYVLIRTTEILLVMIAAFMVLAEIGFNIAPILAGAGIAGIAIGFGAQTLVKDVLSGAFVLLENQYAKGDVVRIAGVSGIVEEVNLRRTVLRDLDGIVHSVPNGEVRVASNFTRGWSRVNLNITVGFNEDLDQVRALLDRLGEELALDPEWGPLILEAPKVLRVDDFAESGMTLKILAMTKPMKQWDVAGELRRRIKMAFDANGIRIPYPHRVVIVRQDDAGAGFAEAMAADDMRKPDTTTEAPQERP